MRQLSHYLKIRSNPTRSREQIERLQTEELRRTLLSAYEHTDFYRQLFDEHRVDPGSVTPSTITRIPVLTKETLRSAGPAVYSRKFSDSDVVVEKTGGSTGKPLEIRHTRDAIAVSQAAKLRVYFEHGYRLTQKICSFLYYPPAKKFYHRLGIHRTCSIPPFMALDDAVKYLQEEKPQVFDGFPSRIAAIARHIGNNDIRGIQPVLVFTNSEAIQLKDKETIKARFANPIDVYMSHEFKIIAWECEKRNGLHVNEDLVHVEIIDPQTGNPVPNGVAGEIVITGLVNEAMPLVRYNTEDVGVLSDAPCSCGRSFILLKELLGRVSDFIMLPSGEQILGQSYLNYALKASGVFNKVVRYQARQKPDKSIDLALDAENLTEADARALLAEMEKGLGRVEVRLLPASAIERTERGKHRVFRSEAVSPDR